MSDKINEALDCLSSQSKFIGDQCAAMANWSPNFNPLKSVVDYLGKNGLAFITTAKDHLPEWEQFLAGKVGVLSKTTIKHLCYNPDVVLDERFIEYLKANVILSRKNLVGLLWSCHRKWSNSLAESKFVAWLQDQILGYKGHNSLINKWKSEHLLVLAWAAHERMADWMLNEKMAPQKCAEEWFLDEESEFFQQSVELAIGKLCKDGVLNEEQCQNSLFDLLSWKWSRERFLKCVSNVICLPIFKENEPARERLKNFVLLHEELKDPRLPANSHLWRGIGDDAKATFISWLSAQDIKFFFDHVLPRGQDPHGRKEFWLQYVKSIIGSRPILSGEDRRRLEPYKKSEGVDISHCGEMLGGIGPGTSAFILDFGSIIAVEFSKTGNALYIYDRRSFLQFIKMSDYWSKLKFSLNDLKDQRRCDVRIVHRDGWKEEACNYLAKQGIRQQR